MEPAAEVGPDWHRSAPYRALLGIDQAGLAWEWLRRDPAYIAIAPARSDTETSSRELMEDPAALPWGLHFRRRSAPVGAEGPANLALGA